MKKLFLLFSVAIVTFACKKSETNTTVNLDLTVNNIKGTYKATGATFTIQGSSLEADVFADSLYKPCKKDDLFKFDSLSVFTYSDAGTQCTPPENYSSPYTLTQPSTLVYSGKTYTVNTLTTSNLAISRYDSALYGTTYIKGTFKIILTRQ